MHSLLPLLLLLLLLLGILHTQASEDQLWVYEVRAFSEPYYHGEYRDFHDKVPHLSSANFDNTIASVIVNGVWIFYAGNEYNTHERGLVHYAWGLDYHDSFGYTMHDKISLRYAGNQQSMNEAGYNLYEGDLFTGKELYGNHNIPDLSLHHQDVTSAIIIGNSSWTFCEEVRYSGRCRCVRADHSDSDHNGRIDVGFYSRVQDHPLELSTVRSVMQGCQ